MSQSCAIQSCKRASRTLCHCCNQNLCRDHFNEHDDLLNSQLNPLTDEINALKDRLAALDPNKIAGDSREKLNQWRIDCHKTIDRFYEEKCQELDQFVIEKLDKQREDIVDLTLRMANLIDKQETTKNDINNLTSAIRDLEQNIKQIEQIRVQVDTHPLMMDDRLIQIEKSKKQQFDLLSLPPPYQTIEYSHEFSYAVASNNRFLLLYSDSNLCLIDESLLIIKKKKWDHGIIGDMCWSFTLNCFILITLQDIFLIDESTISIKRVDTAPKEAWWACGCSDKSLYLSYKAHDSSVLEFSLLPSIQFVQCWKTTDALGQNHRVDSIVYKHETLALTINNISSHAKIIELRSSITFILLWSLQLNINYNDKPIHCCLLNQNEWLVTDSYKSRLFHITNDGKVKETRQHPSEPYCMNLFSSKILTISTKGCINFHKL